MEPWRRRTDAERRYWVEVVGEYKGNIHKAYKALKSQGVKLTYETLRNIYRESGKRVVDIEKEKEAVKLLEANDFNYPDTIEKLKELGTDVDTAVLKTYYRKHALEVCEKDKFKDAISNLSTRLIHRHEGLASSIYEAKELALARFKELIPIETDLTRLSNAYKALNEYEEKKEEKSSISFIKQYNSYYNEKQKDRNKGNIQDATPVSE